MPDNSAWLNLTVAQTTGRKGDSLLQSLAATSAVSGACEGSQVLDAEGCRCVRGTRSCSGKRGPRRSSKSAWPRSGRTTRRNRNSRLGGAAVGRTTSVQVMAASSWRGGAADCCRDRRGSGIAPVSSIVRRRESTPGCAPARDPRADARWDVSIARSYGREGPLPLPKSGFRFATAP